MSPDMASRLAGRVAGSKTAHRLLRRTGSGRDDVLLALGRLESHLLELRDIDPAEISQAEFSAYSQFGEDGILQYLIQQVQPSAHTFIEIGVGDYTESNTRFLVEKDNWRGVAIDGGDAHVRYVMNSGLSWRHDVEPVQAFVTKENISELVAEQNLLGKVGLLSIDVDGIDYWIWDALKAVSADIVAVEFNSLFGPIAKVTVPYRPDFSDHAAHYSRLYFGASLGAWAHLAQSRGYKLVGCTSNAANAFFIREDAAPHLPGRTPEQVWRPSRFLTSRNSDGTLSRIRPLDQRLALIADLPLFDVENDVETTVADAVIAGADWLKR